MSAAPDANLLEFGMTQEALRRAGGLGRDAMTLTPSELAAAASSTIRYELYATLVRQRVRHLERLHPQSLEFRAASRAGVAGAAEMLASDLRAVLARVEVAREVAAELQVDLACAGLCTPATEADRLAIGARRGRLAGLSDGELRERAAQVGVVHWPSRALTIEYLARHETAGASC